MHCLFLITFLNYILFTQSAPNSKPGTGQYKDAKSTTPPSEYNSFGTTTPEPSNLTEMANTTARIRWNRKIFKNSTDHENQTTMGRVTLSGPDRPNLMAEPVGFSNFVPFNFTIYPTYLESVDVRLSTCKMHFHVVKEWRDTRLKWNKQRQGMAGGIMKSADSLWTPDFEPYNGITRKPTGPNDQVMVFPSGHVRLVQSYTITTPVRSSSGFFTPICELRFASWMSKHLKLNRKGVKTVDMSRFTPSNQWELEKDTVKVLYPSGYLEVRAAVVFSLRQQSGPGL